MCVLKFWGRAVENYYVVLCCGQNLVESKSSHQSCTSEGALGTYYRGYCARLAQSAQSAQSALAHTAA
jgi:hypothetical protein